MTMRMLFPSFTVSVPDNWRDVTDSLEGEDCPLTLAVPDDGVGALQLSPAIYQGGPIPSPTSDDLAAMLFEFAEKQGFGHPIEHDTFADDDLIGATASFHVGDDLVVVWYVSNGKNVMLATYVSDWNCKDVEAVARKAIVRSIRF